MMDYKICTKCGEKANINDNFCGNCKSTSFRSPNPVAKTRQGGIIYSLFYWPYGSHYMLSKSKLAGLTTFALLFLSAFVSDYPFGALALAAILGAMVFLVGYLIHYLKPTPSPAKLENNDNGLITDLKNLCFFWQNKNTGEFVLSKTKLITASIFIGLLILVMFVSPFYPFANVVAAAIFTLPAILIGYPIHRLTNNNPTNRKPIKAKPKVEKIDKTPQKPREIEEVHTIPEFDSYRTRLDRLKSTYSLKETRARELIGKKFTPPQLTYTRFIAVVDKSTEIFNIKSEEITNILELASEDSPKIDREINSKFNILESIIDKTDDLINELVLSMDSADDDAGDLIGDMEDLIGSIRQYE